MNNNDALGQFGRIHGNARRVLFYPSFCDAHALVSAGLFSADSNCYAAISGSGESIAHKAWHVLERSLQVCFTLIEYVEEPFRPRPRIGPHNSIHIKTSLMLVRHLYASSHH